MAKRSAEDVQKELEEWQSHQTALTNGLPVCAERIAGLKAELEATKAASDGDFVKQAVEKFGTSAGFAAARMNPRRGGPQS